MEVVVMTDLEVELDLCPMCGMPISDDQAQQWFTGFPDDPDSKALHDGCFALYLKTRTVPG